MATSRRMLSDYLPVKPEDVLPYLTRELIPYVKTLGRSVGTLLSGATNEVLTTVSNRLVWALIKNANIDAAAAIAVSKLAPGTDGQVATTTAGVVTWEDPASAGGSWELVYEPDILAEANFQITVAETAHVVGGAKWIAPIMAGGKTYKFINGTGFQIHTDGGGGFFQPYSAQSSAYAVIPLGTMFSGAAGISGISGPMRIRIRFTLTNGWGTSAGQKIHLGIVNRRDQGDWPTVAAVVAYEGGAEVRRGFAGEGSGAVQYDTSNFALGGCDVAEIRVDANLSCDVRFGTYSGGWPDIDDADQTMWHIGGSAISGVQPWVFTSTVSGTAGTPNGEKRGPHLFFAVSAPGFILFDLTITHLRVEQWNPGL